MQISRLSRDLVYILSCTFARFIISCHLMAIVCMLITCKLPLGGLSRNSVVRITYRPDMTSAVYHGRKEINQTILIFSDILYVNRNKEFQFS